MNYVRFALYGVLFILLMTLVNLWHKDHPAPVTQSATAQILSPETAEIGPVSTQNTLVTQEKNNELTRYAVSADLISIKTDVIQANIDLKGGNLVNVRLPAYPESLQQADKPYQLLNNEAEDFYIAQSGIRSLNPPHSPILYQTIEKNYSLLPNQKTLDVVLKGKNTEGITFTKTYHFAKGAYLIQVSVQAENRSNAVWTGQSYQQLLRRYADNGSAVSHAFHFNPFMGVAYSTQEKPYQKLNFKKLSSHNLNISSQSGWVAMLEHYFLGAWIPPQHSQLHFYTQSENNLYSIGMMSDPISLMPGQTINEEGKLYVGPLITKDLESIAPHLDLTVDYGWLWIISEALFWMLSKIDSLIGNWGWSIVVLTIFVKAAFYKLSASSYRSMAAMRAMQPRLQSLRERYGDDKQKLNQAMMELYRKEKINPLGGCLPMLVQIPVFLALYWVLFSSVELRQAPFILWIKDLAVPDPFYVLPILMGLSMFIQQRLSPAPPDPTQAKVMMFMPVIFTLFFLNFPAGLVLYWLVNNTLSILQQSFVMKQFGK